MARCRSVTTHSAKSQVRDLQFNAHFWTIDTILGLCQCAHLNFLFWALSILGNFLHSSSILYVVVLLSTWPVSSAPIIIKPYLVLTHSSLQCSLPLSPQSFTLCCLYFHYNLVFHLFHEYNVLQTSCIRLSLLCPSLTRSLSWVPRSMPVSSRSTSTVALC